MARVTEQALYFSDVRLDVKCDCARIDEWIEGRWRGARRPILPTRKTFRVDVDTRAALRIAFEGEPICEVPVGPTPEHVFEVYLYGSMLAEHRRRFGVFHGGAVTSSGVAWVFCGPSGAGKSTLVTSALTRGYRYFTDEYVVTDGTDLWGWPRTPEVDVAGSGLEARPAWLDGFQPADEHGTARYPLRVRQVASATTPAELVHFVYLEPGARTDVRPLPPVEALRHWYEAAFHDSPAALGKLAGRGRTWRATWRDPDELLDQLETGACSGPQAALWAVR